MRKLLYGILTIGILCGAACTTDNDEAYEVSSIERSKVRKGPETQAIERSKVRKGPETQAIERSKVRKGPEEQSSN